MLNLSNSNKELKDNVLVVENESGRMAIGRFTDSEMKKIMAYAKSLNGSNPISDELHIEEEKSDKFSTFKLKGKELYCDDATTVIQNGKKYMVTIHIPTFWGKKGTKTKEEHKRKRDWIHDGYKLVAKNHLKANYEGNYDCGDIHWTFPNKKSAEEYIQICKDGKVMEIASAYRPKYN